MVFVNSFQVTGRLEPVSPTRILAVTQPGDCWNPPNAAPALTGYPMLSAPGGGPIAPDTTTGPAGWPDVHRARQTRTGDAHRARRPDGAPSTY